MDKEQIIDLTEKFIKSLESDYSEQKLLDLFSMQIAVSRFSEFLKIHISDLD